MYIKTKEPFGATAVRLGYATSSDVVAALKEQAERERRGDGGSMLGVIMVELGILSASQVATVLDQEDANFYQLSGDAVRLAARLKAIMGDDTQVIQVSGGTSKLCTSMVTNQLALALALMKCGSVLLVDAYQRRETRLQRKDSIQTFFGIDAARGFADLLAGNSSMDETIQPSRMVGLDLMTAGNTANDNITLLMSEHCSEIMVQLRQRYRYIILDSPSLLARAEAPVIAMRADGIVLVVVAGKQRRSEVTSMMDLAAGLNKQVLGTILYRRK